MEIILQDQLLVKLPKEQMHLKFKISLIIFQMLLEKVFILDLMEISIDCIHSNLEPKQVDWEEATQDVKDLDLFDHTQDK